MKKKALRKDFFMEIRKSFNRFASIFVIVALGVAFFSGLQAAAPDMRDSGDAYFDVSDLMDLKVVSSLGLTDEDVDALLALDGISKAEGAWMTDVLYGGEQEQSVLHIESIAENFQKLTVSEGALPSAAGECFLDEESAKSLGLSVGDVLEVEESADSDEFLKTHTFTITGLGSSPEYISYSRGNSSLGSGEVDGILYITADNFDLDYYIEIWIEAEGAKELNAFEDAYPRLIDAVKEQIEGIEDIRCEARYDEVMSEAESEIEAAESEIEAAQSEIEAGESELESASEEADSELESAREELEKGESELESGKTELESAKTEYESGKTELESGKTELESAKTEYEDGKAQLESGKAELESAKTEYESGKAQLESGKTELESAKTKYESGKAQLESGKTELESAKAEYESGKAQLESAKTEVSEGRTQLESARTEAAEGIAALDEQESSLQSQEEELANTQAQLSAAAIQLEQARTDLNSQETAYAAGAAELEAKKTALETAMSQPEADQTQLAQQQAELEAAQVQLALTRAALDAAWSEFNSSELALSTQQAQADAGSEQLSQGKAAIAEARAQLEQAQSEISAKEAELDAAESAIAANETALSEAASQIAAAESEIAANETVLNTAANQITAAESEIAANEAVLNTAAGELAQAEAEISENEQKLADAKEQIEEAESEIAENEQKLADAKEELDDAEKEISENEQKLADGWQEYEDGKAEAESKIADAREELADAKEKLADGEKELADAKEKLADIELPEWTVTDREDSTDYQGYGDNADRMASLAQVFPAMFFLVAALISLTTMTRMVEEQRTQIGTLKALGYGKVSIAMKYLCYALLATAGGSIVGVLFGQSFLPYVIINAYGILYLHMDQMCIPYRLNSASMATALAVACTAAAALASCYTVLRDMPANLMRPPAPKQGKRVFLERIGIIWRHLSFSWKSTVRNLFRYKKRFLMTIFGIGGCMALLLVGFGLRDSIMDVAVLQYQELQLYDGTIIMNEDVTEEEKTELSQIMEENAHVTAWMDVSMKAMQMGNGTDHYEVYLIVPETLENLTEFVVFRDRTSHETYELHDDGVILSEKTAKLFDVAAGDTFLIRSGGRDYEVKVSAVCENYMLHYAYMSEAYYEEIFGEACTFNDRLFVTDLENTNEITALGTSLMNSDAALSISYTATIASQLDRMLATLDDVIYVLIIAAGMLAFVVLYNLNNININERRRELATIKVLGFYDGEVSAYVYRENILLTIIGAVLGIWLGALLHRYVILTVEVDNCMFGRNIKWKSDVLAMLITFGFSAFVNLVMHFKLKKIDMVESLKSVE